MAAITDQASSFETRGVAALLRMRTENGDGVSRAAIPSHSEIGWLDPSRAPK
jgi:hypothetical protein